MPLPDLFQSQDQLAIAFARGLERQLQEDTVGTFILVLANALFEQGLFERLRAPLGEKYQQISRHYADSLRHGRGLADAPDDMLVFLKLMAIGFAHLATTEYRRVNGWELQFNQLRSLRPKRMSGEAIMHLSVPFDRQRFHFNKPFLDKELLWSGDLSGVDVRILYNKFPFAPLHGLLVPKPRLNLPQLLNRDIHGYCWRISAELGEQLPQIAFAYNGFGAGASINHLHLQMFVQHHRLPVLDPRWRHNGGDEDYPARCASFDDVETAWRYILGLHHANITYNLVYLPGRVLCLPRRFQGSYPLPSWCENFAWYEMCGGMTTFDRADFEALEDAQIGTALNATIPPSMPA